MSDILDTVEKYREAVTIVAKKIAAESSWTGAPTVAHVNQARRILWPHCTQEVQSALVLR